MNWEIPEYSRNQVDKAGRVLLSDSHAPEEIALANTILTNWRVVHMYPLNTFRTTLRKRLSALGEEINISQRLKRR